MKKTAITIFSIILIAFFASIVRAQDFTAEKAYQDYQFSLDTYNKSYSDYQHAKDFYLSNQTSSLKEDARQKTLAMLKNRDLLMNAYITALRIKIVETKGLTSDEKGSVFTKIDSEVSWYKSHIENYKDSDSLEDLFNKSSESESRYKTITLPIIYESLFTITLGDEIDMREAHESIYSKIKETIKSPEPFTHFFTDIDLTVKTLKQNETDEKALVQSFYGQFASSADNYNTELGKLVTSLNSLKKLNEFITELSVSVKNQQ